MYESSYLGRWLTYRQPDRHNHSLCIWFHSWWYPDSVTVWRNIWNLRVSLQAMGYKARQGQQKQQSKTFRQKIRRLKGNPPPFRMGDVFILQANFAKSFPICSTCHRGRCSIGCYKFYPFPHCFRLRLREYNEASNSL